MTLRSLAWFALILGLLSGCSGRAPTVSVLSAALGESSPDGQLVQFQVRATNPTTSALPLVEARYSVWIDGERVFAGVRSPESTLSREGEQTITLPASVPAGVAAPGATWSVRGTMTYLSPGVLLKVLFDAGVVRPSVGFSGSGTFPAPGAQPLASP